MEDLGSGHSVTGGGEIVSVLDLTCVQTIYLSADEPEGRVRYRFA